ncbi:hypothetical protein ABNG02_15845 [Halorubrum ejinorense]|uniref:Uncharacterized protein n=1 Tax=Halorubrum ejinorense TaxID=425309 RepID=A0AAV3SRW3_9EURY
MPVEIDRSGPGRWRYTCPRGHIRWKHREESFWCVPCDRTPEYESGRYYTIIDQKNRIELPFEEVRVA